MDFSYEPQGVCSRKIDISVSKDGIIESVSFYGGCNGNTKGIANLVKGMKIDDVISKLEGTTCNMKSTSCPDQLAKALKDIKEEM